jgi:hypothetical protein
MWNFRILGIVLNEDWISLLSLISYNIHVQLPGIKIKM